MVNTLSLDLGGQKEMAALDLNWGFESNTKSMLTNLESESVQYKHIIFL